MILWLLEEFTAVSWTIQKRPKRRWTSELWGHKSMTSGQSSPCLKWNATLRPRGCAVWTPHTEATYSWEGCSQFRGNTIHQHHVLLSPCPQAPDHEEQAAAILPLILTNSSSILVWHFSRLIRLMATRSCLGLHRAAWTTAVAPLPGRK